MTEYTEHWEVVDHAALRSNQAVIIGMLLVAFVSNVVWLVGFVAALMLVGTALRTQAFRWVYTGVLRPLRLVRPNPIPDHAAPHRFAQALGGFFLGVAVVLLGLNVSLGGWAVVWLVIALAALNLFLGFCAGCFMYYWLARWRVPGFVYASPVGGLSDSRASSAQRQGTTES